MNTALIRRFCVPFLPVPILAALLGCAPASAATAPAPPALLSGVGIVDAQGVYQQQLYTEASWEKIQLPMTAMTWPVFIGDALPAGLTLSAAGLPAGVSVTVTGTSRVYNMMVLDVDTERTDKEMPVNTLATFTLKSGDSVLATFQLPVLGTAYQDAWNIP